MLPFRTPKVSIPSRRVGDEHEITKPFVVASVSIPSRRVGDIHVRNFPIYDGVVSIPSRRVGDWGELPKLASQLYGFHPLKAGRRPLETLAIVLISAVSIPSRRVGDLAADGSDSDRQFLVSIPSRRVGDHRSRTERDGAGSVSIPSRRVGDRRCTDEALVAEHRFHPLKAGRRRQLLHLLVGMGSVSIPSRRVGDFICVLCFCCSVWFPSPQGGSETVRSNCLSHRLQRSFHPLKAGRRLRN